MVHLLSDGGVAFESYMLFPATEILLDFISNHECELENNFLFCRELISVLNWHYMARRLENSMYKDQLLKKMFCYLKLYYFKYTCSVITYSGDLLLCENIRF